MEKTFEGLQAACAEIDEAFCQFGEKMEGIEDIDTQAKAWVQFVEAMDVFREGRNYRALGGHARWRSEVDSNGPRKITIDIHISTC